MRILLTSNYKIGNETGSAQVTDLLAFSLAKKHDVCYLCLGEKYKVTRHSKKLTIITTPSVDINQVCIPLVTPNTAIKIESALTDFAPDIVHTQNSVLISKLVQIWANQKNIPIVATFHHVPTQAIRHLIPTLSKNIITKIIEEIYVQTSLKSFLEKINAVIALNEGQKKSIRKVNKNVDIVVINNGIDLTKFKNIKIKKPDFKNLKFVFFGSYSERKNQEFLIETFKYLPKSYSLHFYGKINPNGGYYKKLQSISPPNVYLNDYTNNVPKTLGTFNFFLSASLKEVQSLAVVQALAAGLPVIGLENETISELINDSNGLKVKRSTSSKKLAEKIVDYVENIDYLKTSKRAKADSQKFDIEKLFLQIEGLYMRVVS